MHSLEGPGGEGASTIIQQIEKDSMIGLIEIWDSMS